MGFTHYGSKEKLALIFHKSSMKGTHFTTRNNFINHLDVVEGVMFNIIQT